MLDGRGLRLATDDGRKTPPDDGIPPASPETTAPQAPNHLQPHAQPLAQSLAQPAPAQSFDPWRLFRLMQRQVWTILAVLVAGIALAAIVLDQLTPVYKASALVIVDPWQRSMLNSEPGGATRPADDARVDSEVEILRSPSVLLAAQTRLGLPADPEFAPLDGWLARARAWLGIRSPAPSEAEITQLTLKRLEAATSIARRGETYVIEVTARSKDADKAARIANAIAAAYIDGQIQAKVAVAASVQQRLAQQLEATRATLREHERKLDSFLDDSLGEIQDPELRAELGEIRAAIQEQASTRKRYDALAGRAREKARKREWDALIAELNSDRLVRLNVEHAALRRQFGANAGSNPEAMTKLAQLDRQLDKEAQAVIDRIAAEAGMARDSETELRGRLGRRLAGNDVPADIVLHFREAESDAAALRQVVDKLAANSTAAAAEIELQLPDSRIVSAALAPSAPAFPDKPLVLALAGMGALLAGIGAAMLRDGFAGGFSDESELEAFSGVPVLATLPRIEARPDRPGEKPATETLEHPNSLYSEAIRRLRLGLDLAPAPREGRARVILTVAATAGEGATSTAIALAASLALSGRRTLLIDGDLRRPSIHTELDLAPRHSVADYLAGRGIGAEGLTIDDVAPHLAIACGPADPRLHLDTLLQSSRLDQWIQEARQNFDHVILDSPPVLPVIDALLLLRHVDDILLVVDSATPANDVRAALRALSRGGHGTAHLWLVLNRAGTHKARPAPRRGRKPPAAPNVLTPGLAAKDLAAGRPSRGRPPGRPP
ncbi:chain-length determining protein [Kaistia sp. 32K]|uniref:GumC family protein n=1 Tax=Kaistia sp. 32K TaxID=2795690 RepID=UPI001936AD26|nr:Wzz/FepE/Etk N-terminal domain-containing protein [Kaistia sp. 32K]BCP51582.1 chain-length determining protein [Kaistia sp. 32K]